MLLVLLACSDAAFRGSDPNSADMGGADDTGTKGTPGDKPLPAYWTLGASLDLEDGSPRTASSSVSIELLDESSEVLCSVEVPIASAVAKPSPDEAIYAWWSLTLGADDTCDSGVGTVLLGIGEMNADVEAAIPSLGYDAAASTAFNGAYFGADATTRWAFGVADLEAKFGAGQSVDGPPLSDGVWLVEPLYPFPI